MRTITEVTNDLATLRGFICRSQLCALGDFLRGEEKDFYRDKMAEMARLVSTMPKTYERDGKGDEGVQMVIGR